jgi:prephenate dehydrogenase
MSEPDFLANSRVAIVGLGLMGGSLALALRGRCLSLLGADQDSATLEMAHQKDLFTRLSREPADIVPEADVVILATPVNTILELIRQLPKTHPGSPILLDLGSTKVDIVRALSDLPSRFDPIGGHPMCGKEVSGFGNADVDLYHGAVFAFTPLKRTSKKAYRFADQLTSVIGSRALWIDPEAHDRWCAATSHLPYLVASALASSTPVESKPLVGPGFRSTTRIALTPASIMSDVLQTNRENILGQLEDFIAQLGYYERLLASGEISTLEAALDEAANSQRSLSFVSVHGEAL